VRLCFSFVFLCFTLKHTTLSLDSVLFYPPPIRFVFLLFPFRSNLIMFSLGEEFYWVVLSFVSPSFFDPGIFFLKTFHKALLGIVQRPGVFGRPLPLLSPFSSPMPQTFPSASRNFLISSQTVACSYLPGLPPSKEVRTHLFLFELLPPPPLTSS